MDYIDELMARHREETAKLEAQVTRYSREVFTLREEVGALIVARNRALDSHEHTKQWYAVRLDELQRFAKANGFWPQMAAIVANGQVDYRKPPTRVQLLNQKAWRVEEAEKERDKAVADLLAARDALTDAFDGAYIERDPAKRRWWDDIAEAVRRLRAKA